MKRNLKLYGVMLITVMLGSCKDLVSIPEPIGSVTTKKVFATDAQANSAMAGIYTRMINNSFDGNTGTQGFATGMSTIFGGMSANELISFSTGSTDYLFNTNRLLADNGSSTKIWVTAYDAVYGANAVIEGIEASVSEKLHDEVRKRLTGEAKFIRAFSYFYLVNFFGEVPMALTIDFNKTVNMKKTPKAEVYAQMIKDLQEAKNLLPDNFSAAAGERILPTKWAATALLARVYLYTGDYANAAVQASEVIAQAALFQLPANLNEVFLKNSQEAIWQLQQGDLPANGKATPEGYTLVGNKATIPNNRPFFHMSDELKNDFETNDQRKTAWTWNETAAGKEVYYPYKYKVGTYNAREGVMTEYYMVMRLAEQYLIRAEAQALANQSLNLAIADLNVIRHRAGLDDLPATLSKPEVILAIEHEKEIELFAEWGHRFFDLKRTGRAHDVLSAVPIKQPWNGDYQLLYPIPRTEIIANQNLIQNPGY
ncbi:RagB/SusD family nutrient uptake outer membrane protein [Pedobacter sp. KBW06]|uniref:RagB/SusD family nutrient uptake outer membrane protein n=1 Tax=Pedobacter sp. KBW06 TaxID=2153359 RepID=UPI000F5A9C26|nr:RagB/SusD family nutrient uptake outer membrane protein [Pedobacter sp. KBW06]RQO65943.1 RagB/SusD family nutrient uptake outer membrane protein [Pedobacter sp. KBW06]